MIRRERDPYLVNLAANSAGVRPFVTDMVGPIDFSQIMRACCVLSNGEDAVAAFEQTADRVWQSHTMFMETCRGKRAVQTGREMVAWMLPQWGDILWGATPIANPQARWFNRQIGARYVGVSGYPIGDDLFTVDGNVEYFEIRAETV